MPGWFKALLGFGLLVVAANGILIWKALGGHRDLVRKDYYQAGLDEDGRMARTALAEAPGLRIDFTRDTLGFRVRALRDKAMRGLDPLSSSVCRADFYRPDDGREDLSLELRRAAGESGAAVWTSPAPKLRRGHWRVTLRWMDGAGPVMEKTLEWFSPG